MNNTMEQQESKGEGREGRRARLQQVAERVRLNFYLLVVILLIQPILAGCLIFIIAVH